MNKERHSKKGLLKSFLYAINGLRILIAYEANARIHSLAMVGVGVGVGVAGFWLKISPFGMDSCNFGHWSGLCLRDH